MDRVDVVTRAAEMPVLLGEMKSYLRTGDAEEFDVVTCLRTATDLVEKMTGRSLITRTLKKTFDCWESPMRLDRSPVTVVDSVKYDDADGNEQTLATTEYETELSGLTALVQRLPTVTLPTLDSAQTLGRVRVQYQAGYGANPDDVPEPLRQAVKMLAVHFFIERQAIGPAAMAAIPLGVDLLIDDYRSRYP